ncbi:MAG: cobyrinate a,c-diamide synthase [Peptococcaceae bacterium]
MTREIPRVLIGAVQGRSGKTTFTLGLLKALTDMGLSVQPFKKGPDYIDPSWATFASGVQCRNLDLFMMGAERVRQSFIQHSIGHDISVVEGAMGLFDGLDVDGSNSSAELAYVIDAPVILVVNCTRLTRSAAALVNGVVGFDQRIGIGGVILNNVARARHQDILMQSIARYCDVPVLGILPKSKEIEIPDRHLGLIPAGEQDMLQDRISLLGNLVKANVELDKLLEVARNAAPVEDPKENTICVKMEQPVKIGILRDKAFSFYYPENLEALEQAGAELVKIDSMQDCQLPDIDGMYIGGGFPEVMAQQISDNRVLLQQIKERIEEGLPVYAECGGLMFLVKHILHQGQAYPMVGIFDCDVEMKPKPQGIGYTIQRVLPGNPFFAEDTVIRGHEFHNSHIVNIRQDLQYGFATERGKGIVPGFDGLVYKNTLAGYHHLHSDAAPQWAESLVLKAHHYKQNEK